MARLTAGDIMARKEATFSPDSNIYDALQQLLTNKLTGTAVVDEAGVLLGMLSERDCLKVLVGGAFEGLPSGSVKDYMTSPAESVGPTASLYDLVHLFLTRSYRKLPVVDAQGKVIGQVSRRDALVALASPADNERLYGADHLPLSEGTGVDSAMRIARGRRS